MWSLLLIGVLGVAPPEFEVHVLGGDPRVGPITEWGADRMTVRTADGPVSLDTREIAGISRRGAGPSNVPPSVWAELIDGSRLAGADYAVREGRAGITRPDGEVTDVSARDVAAVQLQRPTEAIAAEWSRILESELDADLLVVRKGDSIDYHRGTLGDVSDKVVKFDLEGDLLAVKRSRVFGLIYYRSAGRRLPDPACWLTEADGSRWAVRSVRLEGEEFRWTTPLGLEVSRAAAEVVRIDFSPGKIVYLSDLEPESLVWTPYFGSTKKLPALARFFGPREDRGLDPGPLSLDGKQYEKGLALHSRTSLVYRLPGRFRRFKAVVGIDDRVRPQGNVRLVIRGDDRVLLETTVAGTDPPLPVDLDLSGVRRLAILVDYGADLDVADHLDLCDARIVK